MTKIKPATHKDIKNIQPEDLIYYEPNEQGNLVLTIEKKGEHHAT